MANFCQKCGAELKENDVFCGNCGNNNNNNTGSTTVSNPNSSKDGLAIAGFVLSIISIFCCGSFSFISLVLSIIGLSNCKKENKSGKGLAIAGIVISTIMILLFVILYAIGFTAGMMEELNNL